jgi:hypothetical protein
MNESKVIMITIVLMTAISYPLGYFSSLYFGEETQLAKVIHLSFIVLFFTSFYASIKNFMMKILKGQLDNE